MSESKTGLITLPVTIGHYTVSRGTINVELSGTKYVDGYLVTNVPTGVVEYFTPSLPDALQGAATFNRAMVNRDWEKEPQDFWSMMAKGKAEDESPFVADAAAPLSN